MNLTKEERDLIEQRRRQEKEEAEAEARRAAQWDREQRRMDTPGTGCLDCNKTEREVLQEGKYEKTRFGPEKLVGGYGYIQLTQWTDGGGMVERDFTEVVSARLCHQCLMARKQQLVKQREAVKP